MILSLKLSNFSVGIFPKANGLYTETDMGYPILRTYFEWWKITICFERDIEEVDETLSELYKKYNWKWDMKNPLKVIRRFK